MPKLPSYRTLIGRPTYGNLSEDEKKLLQAKYDCILNKVQKVLENEEIIDEILHEYPKENEKEKSEADVGRNKRIDALLEKAGFKSKEDKENYERALSFSLAGYQVVYARDIDEMMVNPYNPEITMAWDGNTDFQFCFDFYAIITYIMEYKMM